MVLLRHALPVLLGALLGVHTFAAERAGPSGTICDRNGIPLVHVRTASDGSVQREYPLRAMAAHLLTDLSPDILPRKGDTVFLTLDARIQSVVEEALRKVGRGACVVLDAQSGDILAMASVPSFDPNLPDPADAAEDPTFPLRNRVLFASSPGATFLTVTALAGISAGHREFVHHCKGSIVLGDRVMQCWIGGKGQGHGPETLRDGIKNSCNTYFYTLGVATGSERLAEMASLLGLGRTSGIPVDNEAPGQLPGAPGLKAVSPREIRTEGYTAHAAIGAGTVLASPLQMTAIAATIGNGGTVHQLRLVDRIESPDGTSRALPRVVQTRLSDHGVSAEDVEVVRSAMRSSVQEAGGNARRGEVPGFQVGGRTGTAQYWRSGIADNHTGFICFAESENATYAVGVFVEGAKSGGSIAAPLAARILTKLGTLSPEQDVQPIAPAVGHLKFLDVIE